MADVNVATWGKFSASKAIADLLKWSAVPERETHQAVDDDVQSDKFRGAVGSFRSKTEFCEVFVVMNADIERTVTREIEILCDVRGMVGE